MNQSFWSGITTALMTTAIGTTVSVCGLSTKTVAASPKANSVANQQLTQTLSVLSVSDSSRNLAQEAVSRERSQSPMATGQSESLIAQL